MSPPDQTRFTCPNGHASTAPDYCDVCGAPIDPSAPPLPPEQGAGAQGGAAPAADAGTEACPNCGTPHGPDALFCEGCGYDFTTGAMPRPLEAPAASPDSALDAPAPAVGAEAAQPYADLGNAPDVVAAPPPRWVVEVWIDPDWYTAQQSPDALPSAGPPQTVVVTGRSALVGRVSKSRNIHPEVDCDPDSGVSRRQAQLTTDGSRWWVEDLESANGTFVAPSGGPLPTDPVPVGQKVELGPDDRVYVGAWTRLVVRAAAAGEQG